jgi:hypothetical protein
VASGSSIGKHGYSVTGTNLDWCLTTAFPDWTEKGIWVIIPYKSAGQFAVILRTYCSHPP